MNQEYAKEKAIEVAVYYFRLLAKKTGIHWDSDNDAEITLLIECIIAASVTEEKDA